MKTDIKFNPDLKVQVHKENALRLLCAPFKSHEAGMPEWIKNSSDAYIRLGSSTKKNQIVILFQDGSKKAPGMIGCLDFVGMSTEDIEKKFAYWADPEASGGDSSGVEGGHGNGGKCYMTTMFTSHAYIHSFTGNRGNRYGFINGNFIPGYFPSTDTDGRGYEVSNSYQELEEALKPFNLKVTDLPKNALALFDERHSFTLVLGVGPSGYERRKLPSKKWIELLLGRQQMVRSISSNQIHILHNNNIIDQFSPLSLPDIVPIKGAEEPLRIKIPETLKDPDTGEKIKIKASKESVLVLRTSDKHMRYSPSLRSRHTINGWTLGKRPTGFWEVSSLSRSAYAHKIYGDIYLDALDGYKENDRRNHADSPLIRALTEWLSSQIDKYSEQFVQIDRLEASQEERDELSSMNEALNKWKNVFLEQEWGGVGDSSSGGRGSRKPTRLPVGEVKKVILRLSHSYAGRGVSFRPTVEFYGEEGKRVRSIPYIWQSDDWAVATVDPNLMMVSTHMPGTVNISVSCNSGKVISNEVSLEVLDITDIVLFPREITLSMGSRSLITAKVHTSDERTLEGVYLIWTESNSQIVSIGSGGLVFGLLEGESMVSAGDERTGFRCETRVEVVKADPSGTGGSGYPQILLSEIDNDPLGDKPPTFTAADPPIHQRPVDYDHNIWWINMASPLARRYIDDARGGGSKSKQWRAYHLERYIETMVKILLTYDFENGEELTFETMLRRWDEESARMQGRMAESLQGFLDGDENSEEMFNI